MPEMDGVAAAREIRRLEAEEGRARTPIIAVTANAMTNQVESYKEAGMDGFVAKPVNPQRLKRAIREAVAEDEEPGELWAAQA